MYNGKYGNIRYGLKDGATKVIKIQYELSEKLWNISGHGEVIQISYDCHERFLTSSKAHNTTIIECELEEDLYSESKSNTCYSISIELTESLNSEVIAHKNVHLIDNLHDDIKCECYLSKDIYMNLESKDDLKGELFIGKTIPLEFLLSEQLNTDISANVLEKEIARIEVTIPPGGELRIDSSVFNATMNGENILHLYNGDWITISRDTTTLTVQTATGGNLVGQLLYTERYL